MSELLGLRGRLTAAMVAVGVLTLVVTALLLLFPLDRKLRQDVLTSLGQTARTAQPAFSRLTAAELRPQSPPLLRAVRELRRRTGAEVFVFDDRGRRLAGTDMDARDSFSEVPRALRESRLVSAFGGGEGNAQAQVALPITADGRRLILDVHRSLLDLNGARDVVGRSLLAAALVALAIAVVAGIVLATRLVRRLTALRDTMLRVAEVGPSATVPTDQARDEIGDLARAFATMQRRLGDQEQARRTFVSTASHELRTPLASLRLMLHTAGDELADPHPDLPGARDQVARALGQTVRLGRLAAELLDLSRIDAGLALRAEPVELLELARSVLAEFDPSTGRSGAVVELEADVPVWASADPGAAAQILRILVDNALRHAGPGGRVTVRIDREDGAPTATVSDSGPGVAAADTERIFERFERGSGAHEDGGFGLGLAIGRELARQMSGELRLLGGGGPGATFVACFASVLEAPDPVP